MEVVLLGEPCDAESGDSDDDAKAAQDELLAVAPGVVPDQAEQLAGGHAAPPFSEHGLSLSITPSWM